MADELKPCPFCGSKNVEVLIDERGRGRGYEPWMWAVCDDCDASASPEKTREEAIQAWNRRAP